MKTGYHPQGYGMFSLAYYLDDYDIYLLNEIYNDIQKYRKNKSLRQILADKYFYELQYGNHLIRILASMFKQNQGNLVDIPENSEEAKSIANKFKDLSLYDTFNEIVGCNDSIIWNQI